MATIQEVIKKYWTKTVLIIGLVLVCSTSIYIAINQHSKLTQARAELTTSNLYVNLVEKEKSRLDSTARALTGIIKDRDITIVEKDKKIALGWKAISILQDSLKHSLVNVGEVNADSSYNYLTLRMPPVTERVYPFDSLQVKKIHYTFIERDGLFDITTKQGILISDLNLSSGLKDGQIIDLKNLNSIYISKGSLCAKENEAYKIEIKGKDKVIKQQKFLKNILLPPAAVGVLAVIIKILAK
jgi:galactose-1-phosphate uridylyltransferase